MGLSSSRKMPNKTKEDQVTIAIEESNPPQSIPPQVLQLKLDGDEFAREAGDLLARAAKLRNGDPPDEPGAERLHEEAQENIKKGQEKYREYIGAAFGQQLDELLALVGQAFAAVQQADEMLKKKRKRPGDFYKMRELYAEARDKYWRVKRDMNGYMKTIRGCLSDEADGEQELKPTASHAELMARLDALEIRLRRNIDAIDYFREAQTKPLVLTLIIVITLAIVLILYFCL